MPLDSMVTRSPGPKFAVVVAALALGACGSSASDRPAARSSGLPPSVAVHVGGATVRAEVAGDTKARARGLSGRRSLAEGRGMLFVYGDRATRTYWMKGMRFPIDIIWIDRGRVAGIERNVPVPQGSVPLYSSGGPADHVLEVPAGWAGRHGTARADRVAIERS